MVSPSSSLTTTFPLTMSNSAATSLPNVSHFLPLKLERAQFIPLLRCHSLLPLVDGTSKCLAAFLVDDMKVK